ncbi:phosphotransferase family protein [Mycoplasmopsis opalescens]|uniref:phosphotransferase family protein n=1 Tax=Mycoplasmopsis opalescens TaxID=114886 RepID=UPI0004A774CB|nr:phosphotransferase [Mycoplasmopsis opalescens]
MELIKKGHTNISYFDKNQFYQIKTNNGFNHKLDYTMLEIFDFVPKLISNNEKEIRWEIIQGNEPELTNENLVKIAVNMAILHNSNLKFPATNHASRIKKYRQILQEKNIKINVLNDYFRHVNLTLRKMEKSTPLHNDLWPFNMIDTGKKIFFIDWEYASMGDKHFELAYFIECTELDDEKAKIFLDAYGNYDEDFLLRHRILVNYLVILWAYSQETLPFDCTKYMQRIRQLDSI